MAPILAALPAIYSRAVREALQSLTSLATPLQNRVPNTEGEISPQHDSGESKVALLPVRSGFPTATLPSTETRMCWLYRVGDPRSWHTLVN